MHAWCGRSTRSIVAGELVGERVAEVGRRGKYLIVRIRIWSGSAGAPPDDGIVASRGAGSVGRRSPHARCSQIRQWIGRRLPRCPALRHLGAVRAGRAGRRTSQPRLGPEPLGSLSAARLGERLDRAARAAQVGAPRPADDRRASGTSTSTRRSGRAGSTRCGWPAASTTTELARLHRAIRSVLRKGLERQGSTLRDYALPDGAYGTMQDEFRAYGRGGEPCERCGTPLVRIVVGGRTTTFCPRCQSDCRS